MPLRNGAARFGWPTRALHWLMAVLILGALPLGIYLSEIEPSLSTLWLFGLHKTVGITILSLAVLRVLWHRLSPPPAPIGGVPAWQAAAARWTHRALYALMFAVPLSGWFASSATGIDTVIFGRWTLPRIAPVSEAWEEAGFEVHEALTTLLIAVIALHVAGAVHRAAVRRDRTLRRMLRGG